MSVPQARAFWATTGGKAPSRSSRPGIVTRSTASRAAVSVCEKPRSKLKSPGDDDTQGIDQPILRLYGWIFSIGACETRIIVASRALRWGTTPSIESAIEELTGQPAW